MKQNVSVDCLRSRSMPVTTVFVVAPNAELRRSLEFLFRAEDMQVVARADLGERLEIDDVGRSCAVVDENAIAMSPDGWARLARIARPVILLVDRMRPIPECYRAIAVRKPLLGPKLVEAVREAAAR
jgi:hypothetical protein